VLASAAIRELFGIGGSALALPSPISLFQPVPGYGFRRRVSGWPPLPLPARSWAGHVQGLGGSRDLAPAGHRRPRPAQARSSAHPPTRRAFLAMAPPRRGKVQPRYMILPSIKDEPGDKGSRKIGGAVSAEGSHPSSSRPDGCSSHPFVDGAGKLTEVGFKPTRHLPRRGIIGAFVDPSVSRLQHLIRDAGAGLRH